MLDIIMWSDSRKYMVDILANSSVWHYLFMLYAICRAYCRKVNELVTHWYPLCASIYLAMTNKDLRRSGTSKTSLTNTCPNCRTTNRFIPSRASLSMPNVLIGPTGKKLTCYYRRMECFKAVLLFEHIKIWFLDFILWSISLLITV